MYFQTNPNIQVPANLFHFNRLVGSIVNFDILDPEKYTKLLFNFDFDKAQGKMQDQLETG